MPTVPTRRASSGFRTGSAVVRRRWRRPTEWTSTRPAKKPRRRWPAAPNDPRRTIRRSRAGMEPVFRSLEIAARTAVRVTGTRITYRGLQNIPSVGGAVVAINHTSYIDFLPAALAAMYRKRRLRFMIKAEMQDVKMVDFLIKHSKTIPVDRRAGADAFPVAVQRLREGELVGV